MTGEQPEACSRLAAATAGHEPEPIGSGSEPPTRENPGLQRLVLAPEARILFASDMHIGEHDPATAGQFMAALRHRARECTHLILLGDLFEAWVGDDQTDPVACRLLSSLHEIALTRPVYVMRGNRDFLLDVPVVDEARAAGDHTSGHSPSTQPFRIKTGVDMLADPCLLKHGAIDWLLTHGDALCTDDLSYQAFRLESRQPAWQQAFLSQPLARRMAIAREMRQQSEREKSRKAENLTDVNEDAAFALLVEHATSRLIHGHTHRPGHHVYQTDGRRWERWVLPDWDAAEPRGGFLMLVEETARLISE